MTTARIGDVVLATSDATVVVEGNHYFPPDSVDWNMFTETELSTVCPWKGTASYYTVTVGDEDFTDVAWTYHEPKDAAAEIRDHVAFYSTVTIDS